jgi:hypothetical protein
VRSGLVDAGTVAFRSSPSGGGIEQRARGRTKRAVSSTYFIAPLVRLILQHSALY